MGHDPRLLSRRAYGAYGAQAQGAHALGAPQAMAGSGWLDEIAAPMAKKIAKHAIGFVPGVGPLAKTALDVAGWGAPAPDSYDVKPKRRPVVDLSGRNKIVKQVMQEKGMKMIEASKYVKQHNLWTR